MSIDFSQLKGIPKQFLPEKIHSIQVINGGLNNRNFLLNDSILIKNYLERDEKNDPVYLRYIRERDAFLNLEGSNFVPKMFKTSESENQYYLSRDWLNGDIIGLTDIQNDPYCLINPLIQLHSKSYSSQGDYKYFDVISRYLVEFNKNEQRVGENIPKYSVLKAFFDEKRHQIESSEQDNTNTRIHDDLVFANIVVSKDRKQCSFIDWEYTTISSPLIDLAYLFTQNPIPEKLQKSIFSFYCQSIDRLLDKNLLEIYKQVMILMSALWYSLQAIRMKKGLLNHQHISLSFDSFQNLAEQTFRNLNLI